MILPACSNKELCTHIVIGGELQRKKVIWAGEFLNQPLDMYFSCPVPLMETGSAAAAQLAGALLLQLPCLLALWSGVLAVTSFLSISVCPVLTLLFMFCACSHLRSQLFSGPICFFAINHVPLEVFNVNRQA